MLLERQAIYDGRVIKVSVDTVELPNGHRLPLEIVRHPGGAAVVAIDAEDRVCLLRQFRHAAGGYIYELPAGKLEPGEPPEVTARRELVEEAAFGAAEWTSLGSYFSSPGVFTEVIHLYLATQLTPAAANPEAGEVFEVEWWPLALALERARNGELADGKTIIGILRAAARKKLREAAHRPGGATPGMVAMSNNLKTLSVILRPVGNDDNNGKPPAATNRRRASQIVHDDRGNARVEWIDAGYAGEPLERAPLSIESTPARGEHGKLTVERGRAGGFDPYARVGAAHIPESKKPQGKRDLRKLGEWIKMKRELEARKDGDPEPE